VPPPDWTTSRRILVFLIMSVAPPKQEVPKSKEELDVLKRQVAHKSRMEAVEQEEYSDEADMLKEEAGRDYGE
jgi:hypothetical protein